MLKIRAKAKNMAQLWLELSLCERDFDGASRALAAMPIDGCYDDWIPFPQTWCEGVVAQIVVIKRQPMLPLSPRVTKRPKCLRNNPIIAAATLCARDGRRSPWQQGGRNS